MLGGAPDFWCSVSAGECLGWVMVRWGLGVFAAVLTVMLLIPAPLRPDRHGHADTPQGQPGAVGLQTSSRVAAPQLGVALMSLPEEAPAEAPVPVMPEAPGIAATTAPVIPSAPLPEPPGDPARLAQALAPLPAKFRSDVYSVAVAGAELRAGPSSLERGISLLAEGDRVEVLSRYADRWVFVRLADGTTEGYLDATLLSPAD